MRPLIHAISVMIIIPKDTHHDLAIFVRIIDCRDAALSDEGFALHDQLVYSAHHICL